MNFYKITKGSKKLIIFFAGWGMDEEPFIGIENTDYDVVIIYDYSLFNELDSINNLEKEYSQVYLIAWSIGVWAANKYVINNNIHLTKAIAINGTVNPINDTTGIPINIYNGTIENLPNALQKFNLRMCGGKSGLAYYSTRHSKRDVLQIKEELIQIKNMYFKDEGKENKLIRWDYSIISLNDNIFPTSNQLNFWESNSYTKIIKIEASHYLFNIINSWNKVFELCMIQ